MSGCFTGIKVGGSFMPDNCIPPKMCHYVA